RSASHYRRNRRDRRPVDPGTGHLSLRTFQGAAMFVELATSLVPVFGTAELAAEATLTTFNSTQLADFLEQSWAAALSGVPIPNPFEINAFEAAELAGMARINRFEPAGLLAPPPDGPVPFHHLVYAFALENTRMVEIFRRVVSEFALGERLSLGS